MWHSTSTLTLTLHPRPHPLTPPLLTHSPIHSPMYARFMYRLGGVAMLIWSCIWHALMAIAKRACQNGTIILSCHARTPVNHAMRGCQSMLVYSYTSILDLPTFGPCSRRYYRTHAAHTPHPAPHTPHNPSNPQAVRREMVRTPTTATDILVAMVTPSACRQRATPSRR